MVLRCATSSRWRRKCLVSPQNVYCLNRAAISSCCMVRRHGRPTLFLFQMAATKTAKSQLAPMTVVVRCTNSFMVSIVVVVQNKHDHLADSQVRLAFASAGPLAPAGPA